MGLSRLLLLLIPAALALLTSACASGTTPANPEPVDLSGTAWVLSQLGDAAAIEGTSTTIAFTDDGEIGGTTGCNRYGGSYTTDGASITIESGAMTMIACEDPVMGQERGFLEALAAASTFEVVDEQLSFLGDDGAAVAVFTAQDQELAGTQWSIAMYNDGVSAVTSVIQGTEPTIAFGEDGTLSGNGGCNQFSGGFTAEDGTIQVEEVATTQMACTEPDGVMDQEAAIHAALTSAATYTVEGQTLTLRTADDQIALELQLA